MGNKSGSPAKVPKNKNADNEGTKGDTSSTSKSTKKSEPEPVEIDVDALPEITMDEVAKHDDRQKGVWIVLNGLVYDTTPFLPLHPGGPDFLLDVGGEDATQEFEAAMHTESARMKTRQFVIGKLKKEKSQPQALSLPNSFGAPQMMAPQNVRYLPFDFPEEKFRTISETRKRSHFCVLSEIKSIFRFVFGSKLFEF